MSYDVAIQSWCVYSINKYTHTVIILWFMKICFSFFNNGPSLYIFVSTELYCKGYFWFVYFRNSWFWWLDFRWLECTYCTICSLLWSVVVLCCGGVSLSLDMQVWFSCILNWVAHPCIFTELLLRESCVSRSSVRCTFCFHYVVNLKLLAIIATWMPLGY